jgi:hypothetical protein
MACTEQIRHRAGDKEGILMRLSRIMRQVAAVAFALQFFAVASLAADQGQQKSSTSAASNTAAQLVHKALVAEAAGETERRTEYLKDALVADPDYAPAHWQSGEVRIGDQWLKVESAASHATRTGKVAKYRQLRDAGHNTTNEHLQLARWCAADGLADQERFHLLWATQSVTTKKQRLEIVKRLNLVRYQGTMMPPAQAELLKSQAKTHDKAMQEWKPRIVAIRRDIEGRDAKKQAAAFNQLRSIKDPAAIPALEAVLVNCKPDVLEVALATIAAMSGQSATDSLIRHVVFCEDESVRQAAAEALTPRSIYSYAPTLMSALQSPVEVQFDSVFVNGQYRHRLTLFQEGPLMDQSFVSNGGSHEDVRVVTHPMTHRATDYYDHYTPDPTANTDALHAERELSANVVRTAMNQRVTSALQVATGNDFGAEPAPWWDWWLNYNEMYQPPYKPVSQVVVNNTPAVPYTYRVSSVSCFVAGTPVQTTTGPMPIEQVKPGECVLAQDPDSGELTYKPVIVTTVRPPSPLVEIQLERETIRATRGHPFWVSGIGWQMAKELQAGQWLHTTSGPAQIESVEQTGEAECFNMIVADFNTYFVGDAQVLVHDNNLRQVTTATVPGMVDP